MVGLTAPRKKRLSPFKRWLYEGTTELPEGPHEQAAHARHRAHAWWQVMCLTGVDYFSTLGYQPGIAFLAAGALSPIATLILVLLTLFGAYPIYSRVAVLLVGAYLLLNGIVVGYGVYQIARHMEVLARWRGALFTAPSVHGNPLLIIGVSLLLFPKLALGLSGFETGVAVMPLIKGEPTDTEERPPGRIRGTRHLLITAALIMSVYLIASSLVTTTLIPPEQFRPAIEGVDAGGKANGRALAYLAYHFFGNGFGTAYDISTILILWFAGASAMAGLLNIVPRYLPRYGMAPNGARAQR